MGGRTPLGNETSCSYTMQWSKFVDVLLRALDRESARSLELPAVNNVEKIDEPTGGSEDKMTVPTYREHVVRTRMRERLDKTGAYII